jgi:hypothetical protein
MAYNTAEGGSNGVTVTAANSGGLSGVPFDTLVIGDATATLTFDNTHPAHGALSYKFQLGAVATECYVAWTTGFTPVNVPRATFRIKGAYFTANPGATIYLYRVANIAGTNTFGLALDTAGKLLIKDGGGTIVATMATAIPLSTLFDLEVTLEVTGTTGTVKVYRSDVADSDRPTDQLSGTVTAAVPVGRVRWGHTGTGVMNVGPWWYDDLEAVLPDGVVMAPDTFLDNDLILPEDGGTSPLGSMYQPWPLQVLDVVAPSGNAPAENASATAAGEQPTIRIDTIAENASATAAANAPTVKVSPGPGSASAAASANNPTIRVEPGPSSAAATASANQPSPAIRVNPTNANAAAAANDATVSTSSGAGATNAPAGVANANATAEQPTVKVSPSAGVATATASANQPTITVKPGAGIANAAASANQPSPAVQTNAGNASAAAAANNTTSKVATGPTVANTAATANQPTVQTGSFTNAVAQVANAAAAANGATGKVATGAQVANATGTANQPGPSVRASAVLASAAAIVNNAAARIAPTPGVANAAAQARDPGGKVLVGAGVATSAAAAWDATTAVPPSFTNLTSRGLGPRYTARTGGAGRTATGSSSALTSQPDQKLTAKPTGDRYDVE